MLASVWRCTNVRMGSLCEVFFLKGLHTAVA